MSNKLLTLAVPTYNMEKYLARCLDSVLCENQDFLEVLVVNDGSKDRSSAIGHEYAVKYPNVIRVIDKENGNYGSCVNRALDEATGKYFRMLDADDWCEPKALNEWIERLKICDADMVLTVADDRTENGSLLRRLNVPSTIVENKIYKAEEFDAIKLGYKYLFCSHVVTYKTSILKDIHLRLQHGISYTDNEYVFFPLDHINTIVYYNLPVYQYFVGREGQTTQQNVLENSFKQLYLVFSRLFEYYRLRKNIQIHPVLNNQKLVLLEILHWIYYPLFCEPITESKKECLKQIEQLVCIDKDLYSQITQKVKLLSFYRRTRLYADSPITRVYNFWIRGIEYIKKRVCRRSFY